MNFQAIRDGLAPLPDVTEVQGNPEAAEAAKADLEQFVNEVLMPYLVEAHQGLRGADSTNSRTALYKGLLFLQRRFFLLAYRLDFIDLEPLYETYRLAYRKFEDGLYTVDMLPAPPIAPAGAEPEPEIPEPLGIEVEDDDGEETE